MSGKSEQKVLNNSEEIISAAQKYFHQAEELRQNLKYKESVENYLYSIMIDRENYTSYLGLAMSYKNLKNYNKAILNLQKAEKLSPFDVEIQKELALCNIIKGEFETGISYLRTAIRLEPDNLNTQMQLALVHEMIEEEDMALMIYQKIIETNPDYIRAYIQKATLYMHICDYLNSARLFKEIIKKDKEYYRAYLALAICCEKLDNIPAAKRYYKKYINLCKDCNNYKEVMNRLKELNGQYIRKNHNLKVMVRN